MLREKEMFDNAYLFLEKHYNDRDFGDLENRESAIAEYQELQKKYKGSGLWQELLLAVNDHLERKMKYERRKANGQQR